ncbi:histidine phosphatase family protein [Rhodobacteraceae bacterium NNCM2]|nr:histidine phosphatase family protein [Coraliihabitans acroporae]
MIFLRHPTPLIAQGTCYGRLDVELGPAARNQIPRALNRLAAAPQLVSSPAKRCLALAEAIAERFGTPLKTDPRLLELDFGAWEGKRWAEIDRAESDPWAADPWNIAPPAGETFCQLSTRVIEAIGKLHPKAIVVTHAGPIRAARIALTGAAFAEAFSEPVPHATPIRIEREVA